MESGFDVNIQNKKGETPLMRAIVNSCEYEVIQLLINYEANVNMLSNSGYNIFDCCDILWYYMKSCINEPLVKLILTSGFDLKLLTKR